MTTILLTLLTLALITGAASAQSVGRGANSF